MWVIFNAHVKVVTSLHCLALQKRLAFFILAGLLIRPVDQRSALICSKNDAFVGPKIFTSF